MHIKFQTSYANSSFEGNGVYSYKNNKEAKEAFFNSLTGEKVFCVGDADDEIELDIQSAEKTEMADPIGGYMNFMATASYKNKQRGISVPVLVGGTISFNA